MRWSLLPTPSRLSSPRNLHAPRRASSHGADPYRPWAQWLGRSPPPRASGRYSGGACARDCDLPLPLVLVVVLLEDGRDRKRDQVFPALRAALLEHLARAEERQLQVGERV